MKLPLTLCFVMLFSVLSSAWADKDQEDDWEDDITDVIEKEKEQAEENAEKKAEHLLEKLLEQRAAHKESMDGLEEELEDWLEQQLEAQDKNDKVEDRLEKELEKRLEALKHGEDDEAYSRLLDDKLQQLWQFEDDLVEASLPALAEQSIALLSVDELELAQQEGARILNQNPVPELGAVLVTFDRNAPIPARFQAEPNHLYQLDSEPFTKAKAQSPLAAAKRMGQQEARPAKQRIGMMDSAIAPNTPCLDQAHIRQQHFHPQALPASAALDQTHGTAMASILVGQCQAAGLLSSAELFNAVVFAQNTQGQVQASAAQLVEGLNWLLAQQVSIINLSLSGPPNRILERAIRQVAARGVTLVASAGNDGPAAFARFPAAYPEVIAVTAVDAELQIFARAGQGAHIEVAAPGVGLWVQGPQGVVSMSGTSLAAAMVSATLAQQPKAKGRLDLSSRCEDLGEAGRDRVFGFGLLKSLP